MRVHMRVRVPVFTAVMAVAVAANSLGARGEREPNGEHKVPVLLESCEMVGHARTHIFWLQ